MLIAKLIKIGDLKIGPGADAPRVGFISPSNNFRSVVASIGSDDPGAITAFNRQRQLVDDAAVFVLKVRSFTSVTGSRFAGLPQFEAGPSPNARAVRHALAASPSVLEHDLHCEFAGP